MWAVKEEWRVIDRWWTEQPVETEWVDVDCDGRRVVFFRDTADPLWRVHRPGWYRRHRQQRALDAA